MPRTKTFKINLTDEQIDKFKNALSTGAPLMVALSFAKIPTVTYFYYVDLANISAYFREKEYLKQEDEMIKSGIDLEAVRNESAEFGSQFATLSNALRPYKEPTATSILRYKNNKTFKALCDQVYDLLEECNMLRAGIAIHHLVAIRKAVDKRGVNTQSSQWFLERTMPDYFGRVDKTRVEANVKNHTLIGQDETDGLPPIKVEFVDPNTRESKDRVRDMEELVDAQLNGKKANA